MFYLQLFVYWSDGPGVVSSGSTVFKVLQKLKSGHFVDRGACDACNHVIILITTT